MNYLEALSGKKIAIIGLGYLGSNLHNFLKQNQKLYGFELLEIRKDNLNIVEKTEFDYVINSAGNSGDFRNHVLETIESNVGLIVYLLKHLKVRQKLLVLSSTRIYGFTNNTTLFNECFTLQSNHLDLDFIYNGSKCLTESIIHNYSNNLSYPVNIIRLSNVYGKFETLDDSTLIKKIIRAKIEKKDLILSLNRKSTKDYIYIDDAVDGILRALIISHNNDIFNIASGISLSLLDISKILGLNVVFKNECKDEFHSNISIEKAQKELKFHPNIPFQKLL